MATPSTAVTEMAALMPRGSLMAGAMPAAISPPSTVPCTPCSAFPSLAPAGGPGHLHAPLRLGGRRGAAQHLVDLAQCADRLFGHGPAAGDALQDERERDQHGKEAVGGLQHHQQALAASRLALPAAAD